MLEQNKTSSGWLSQLGHGMSLSAQGLCLGLAQETRAYSSKNSTLGVSGGFPEFWALYSKVFRLGMGFWCFGASGLGLTVFMRVSGALGWSFKSLAGSRVLGIGLQVSSGRVALVQASFACTDAGQQTFANHAGHPCAANSTSKG